MIYWILINYFNEDDIISLIEANKSSFVIFLIVDNSNTFSYISKDTSLMKVLRPSINLGYIGGFQFALQQLNLYENKKIILSNSDINIFNSLDVLTSISDRAIIVPGIKNLDSKLQNPHLIFKPRKSFFSFLKLLSSIDFLWLNFLFLRKIKSIILPNIESSYTSNDNYIYAGHGSFIYFNDLNLTYFKKKQFNFLFGEEIHFAEFAKSCNYPIIYNPLFKVLHREHSTTSTINFSKKRDYYFKSYSFILNNYYK